MKKLLSLLLVLLMLAIMLPMVALAADETGIPAGTDKPVQVWTGYSGSNVASYASIEEAVTNLGEQKWIVIGKDYTLEKDFTIPDGVFLDVAENATLTVKEGVTLTVAANAKRLAVRAGGTLVNNGKILVCGTDYKNGKFMLQDDGNFDISSLSVPDGYLLAHTGSNYYAGKADYKVTFNDGTEKVVADKSETKGSNVKQITLLSDISMPGWTILSCDVGDNFVLNLGGYTLTITGESALSFSAPMAIKNGTIKYNGTTKGAINSGNDLIIASDAVIDGGDSYAIWPRGYGHTLTVYGTVKSNGAYAITGNGNDDGNLTDECNITIQNGAVVSAPNGIAIYHPELGTVTINGGNITGHTGVEMCAGKLVVNGGNITSTGDNFDATGSQNAIKDGAAISIINRNYPGGIPTAEIKGGTIKATGAGAFAVKAYDYTTNNTVADWETAPQYVTVTGGIFSGQNEAIARLIPKGYVKNPFNETDDIVKPSTITIIVPSKDDNTTATTPGTAPNPATGANDLVAVAVAAAALALAGSAIILRKD